MVQAAVGRNRMRARRREKSCSAIESGFHVVRRECTPCRGERPSAAPIRETLYARPGALPVISALALVEKAVGARRRRDGRPFAMNLLFFFATFPSLEVIFWPHVIADGVRMASATRPGPRHCLPWHRSPGVVVTQG